MSDEMKRIGAIVAMVVCVGFVAFLGYKLFAPPALEQGVVHPSPAKSMAQMEKEKEASENASAQGSASGSGAADEDPSARLAGSR